jgi:hypothetical protein
VRFIPTLHKLTDVIPEVMEDFFLLYKLTVITYIYNISFNIFILYNISENKYVVNMFFK